MSVAFWLALSSGALHAVWNAFAKRLGHPRGVTVAVLLIGWLCGVGVVLATGGPKLSSTSWPWVLLSGLGEATYVFCLGQAYRHGDLSITYAVTRASALAAVWPMSMLAFGSTAWWLPLAATALVGVGIVVMRPSSKETGSSRWHPGWTLATGVAIAGYHTGYKGAVATGTGWATAFVLALLIACPLLLLVLGREVRAEVKALLGDGRTWFAGAACGGSFLMLLLGLTTSESTRMLGVRNASVGFAVLLGVWLGERLSARQWVGLGVLGAGVVLFGLEPR